VEASGQSNFGDVAKVLPLCALAGAVNAGPLQNRSLVHHS
jgi:hypothetical protein